MQVKNRSTRIPVPEAVSTKMNKLADTKCVRKRNSRTVLKVPLGPLEYFRLHFQG